MDTFSIAATRNTPAICIDPKAKRFRISGNSIPENAGEFYSPVIELLREALPIMENGSTFEFCLPYFNSSSLKAIYLLLLEVKKVMDAGKKFKLIWYVEEDDDFMSEAAETYSEMLEMDFTLRTGIIKNL